MQRSEQINELAAALCKAQGAIEGARKDSVNPHFKTAYADLASVWEAVRKPLSDNGLAVTQWPRTVEHGVEVETVLMHVSGQFMSDVLWMPVLKMDAQGVGSACTYAKRYALAAVTGVAPVGEDDDANGAGQYKPGVPGSAGGGTDFRPERRSYAGHSSANGRRMAEDEPHLADNGRTKGTVPGKPSADAIKMVERVKKAIAFFKDDLTTYDSAREYWHEREDPIAEIEAAMPKEYERMLDAYNACLERTSARAV